MIAKEDNPFTPGMGRFPPFLAGRGRIRDKLIVGVNRVAGGKPGNSIVLYGPRGNGKTALLLETKAHAEKRKAKVRRLTAEDIARGAPGIAMAMSRDPDPGDNAPQTGFTGGLAPRPGEMEEVTVALRSAAKSAPTVLLVDEAHAMPAGLGRILLPALQDAISDGLPLLAVLAGTPELPGMFREMEASFWERSDRLRVGRIESDDAAREGLAVPAGKSGLPMDGDALELLARESQRYPFFLQMFGEAAWGAANDRGGDPARITLADAEAGMADAEEARELFCEERRREIYSQGVLREAEAVSVAMAEAAGKGGVLPWKKLEETLVAVCNPRSAYGTPPWIAQERLEALGLIWSRRVGEWEPGIPSLCSHLVRHAGRGEYAGYRDE